MTNLTLDSATAILARGREHAHRIGVPMNLAVTDGGGQLLAFAGAGPRASQALGRLRVTVVPDRHTTGLCETMNE